MLRRVDAAISKGAIFQRKWTIFQRFRRRTRFQLKDVRLRGELHTLGEDTPHCSRRLTYRALMTMSIYCGETSNIFTHLSNYYKLFIHAARMRMREERAVDLILTFLDDGWGQTSGTAYLQRK